MLKRISGRVALIIVAAAVLVVFLLGWFAFVSPQRSKASTLDAQIANTRLQIADNEKLLSGPAKRTSLAESRKIARVMPNQPLQSQLIRQLSAIAKSSEVQLTSISPSAAVVGATDEALPLAVSVNGHYFAIQRFLRLLRASADVRNGKLVGRGRLFTVDSISFAGGAGSSGSSANAITATLALHAYQSVPTVATAATVPTTTTASATSASAAGQ